MNDRVLDIAESLGLNNTMDQRTYVRTMRDRFGRTAERFMDVVDDLLSSGGAKDPVKMSRAYRLKHANWEMSLLISQRADGRMHSSLLDWIAAHDVGSAKRVCEVGCDVGLFSCSLALLLEDSAVVGIDRLAEAVRAARLHSVARGIDNIRFEKADLHRPVSAEFRSQFDFVVCPWVMQELVPSLRQSFPISEDERGTVENIVNLMEEDGMLLMVDRLPYGLDQQLPLVEALEDTGMDVIQRDLLVVNDHGRSETFPLSLLRKG